jgi:hypothetical protein
MHLRTVATVAVEQDGLIIGKSSGVVKRWMETWSSPSRILHTLAQDLHILMLSYVWIRALIRCVTFDAVETNRYNEIGRVAEIQPQRGHHGQDDLGR